MPARELGHGVNHGDRVFKLRRHVRRPDDFAHAIRTQPDAKLLARDLREVSAHWATSSLTGRAASSRLLEVCGTSVPLFGGPADRVGPVALRPRFATGLPCRLFDQLRDRLLRPRCEDIESSDWSARTLGATAPRADYQREWTCSRIESL